MQFFSPHTENTFRLLRGAAQLSDRVGGLTHRHYKYPARFSPQFVGAAIEHFSKPGDLVLDPYMGGGTTLVEAMAMGRQTVGCDLNSLAVFVTKVKTARLSRDDTKALSSWALNIVPTLSYYDSVPAALRFAEDTRTKNLNLPRARPIKKLVSLALASLTRLPSAKSEEFARCAILNCSQWALNGRKGAVALSAFRQRLTSTVLEMLQGADQFAEAIKGNPGSLAKPILIHDSAENIGSHGVWKRGALADLVVTSPPYPGVHMLYHRWQVDGRKETPAPYWIANKLDGKGPAYYSFGGRFQENHDDYFSTSLRTLCGIRSVMKEGATIIQMIAFSDPRRQLPRYLANMEAAGFGELRLDSGVRQKRIWRSVPNRTWHATLQGPTSSAREVVLIHVAD